MKKTKVIINTVTVKEDNGSPDNKKVLSWEYEKDDETISEAEIVLLSSVNDLVDLRNGLVVEIWGGWTTSTDKRFFYGSITSIIPEGKLIKIRCKNEMIKLVRKNINHIYDSSIDASAGEISEIGKDMIETYGGMTANVQSSGTEDGKRIDQFKCINSDIYERLVVLKKALKWDLFYNDSTREVHLEPEGFTDSGITLTVGSEIIGIPKWDFDDSNMINDLRVEGATSQTEITESGQIGVTSGYTTTGITLTKTPDSVELYMDAGTPPTTQKTGGTKDSTAGNFYYVDRENKKVMQAVGTTFSANHYAKINYIWSSPIPIHMVSQGSIDLYGNYEKTINFSDISSVADAESRAIKILEKRSRPYVTGSLLVKSASTNIPNKGETINVVDTLTPKVNGIDVTGTYVVHSIKYSYPSTTEEIIVGEKIFKIVDWQETTEQRLKRLEEQFVRNQDILMELVEISNDSDENSKLTIPRYFKVISENYDVSNDRMIWDNADHGVWDNDKWGDGTDTFESEVINSIQQYLNSYTEDFIDSDFEDTTGNASWSTTGSATFTAGQIAKSLSIDKNNGTIITATLTSTEVSGSFDYEMTADNTNWESVTSGTAHTFVNSGTDLRWRATESVASTGEISKIEVTSYH